MDLGLPSGTLWATMNVGASKPSDYGLYFQWGDTIGYTKEQIGKGSGQKAFTLKDYKFNPSGDGKTFTKYANKGATLELEDDATNVIMGGDWHIPSPIQINELLNNTTRTWMASNSVNGFTFTSNKDTSKSIFIPAAGYAYNGSVRDSGSNGCVWSSTLALFDVKNGRYLDFYSGGGASLNPLGERSFGLSVRGVIG